MLYIGSLLVICFMYSRVRVNPSLPVNHSLSSFPSTPVNMFVFNVCHSICAFVNKFICITLLDQKQSKSP